MNQATNLPPTAAEITTLVEHYCRQWQAARLARQITVEFSSRMKRSLGLTYPTRKLIRLRHDLQIQPRAILKEVLCHELAHVVAYQRFGPRIKPHGPQWQALVSAAGFNPTVTLDVPFVTSRRHPVRRFRHSCPVCHTSRVAYRSMRRWRCGACLDHGLVGVLDIEEVV